MCPGGLVYNLSVEGHETYVADGFIVHNCHHAPAQSLFRVLSAFPACYRAGASATPDRSDGLGPAIRALLGQGGAEVSQDAMVELGRLVLPTVRLIDSGFRHHGSDRWDRLQRARAQDLRRNAVLCVLVRDEFRAKRRVLLLVELVDHAQTLAGMLSTHMRTPAIAVVGQMSPHERRRAYRLAEEGRTVLVATRLADEGLDLPALDVLVLGAPGRSAPRLKQQVGRIMRAWKGKSGARVYDLCDMGVPTLAEQARARYEVYREMGWSIERQGA